MLLELVPGEAIAPSGLKGQSREWFPEVAGRETEPLPGGGIQSGAPRQGGRRIRTVASLTALQLLAGALPWLSPQGS